MKPTVFYLFCFFTLSAWAKPTRFEVKDAAFRNLIFFTSDAALEKTLGRAHFLSGSIEVDPQALKSGAKAELQADMRSFDLGPESTQVKLRETLLAVDQFPGATFKLEKLTELSADSLNPGKAVTGLAQASLFFRGVTRTQTVPVKVTYLPATDKTRRRLPGNLLKVSSNFEITLGHFQFPIPEELNGLLAPVLKVSVDLVATDQVPVSP